MEEPDDDKPIDVLDRKSLEKEPFKDHHNKEHVFVVIISDDNKTNNLIKIFIFSGILLLSGVAFIAGFSLTQKDDHGTKQMGTSVITTVVTTLLGLGAGAGLR